MRTIHGAWIAACLTCSSSALAQEEPPTDVCEGPAALVCLTLAIPIGIAIIDEAIDRACPGAHPPGEWPEGVGVRPAYPEQWYRECDVARAQ